jgi:NACHT domain
MDKLTVEGAVFDSYDEDYMETCLNGTRVDLLDTVDQWANNPNGKCIFWLQGGAGTGKSTISRTVAHKFADSEHHGPRLGASFFFKRGEGDRGSASRFFSTIIGQLVVKLPDLAGLVAEGIRADPFISTKALGEKFDKLIYQPLQNVIITPRGYSTLIVVVDALDECDNERDMRTIIDLWSRLPHITTIKLRLFLTSRPDIPILQEFKRISTDVYQDMVLQDIVPHATIHHDITLFLEDAFSKIRKNYNNDPPPGSQLEHDWPGDKDIQVLTDMATPLFIVAATVCRFVGDIKWNPRTRLKKFLETKSVGKMSQIEQTYLPVLQQLSADVSDSRDLELLYEEFRMIVGSIIILAESLSIASLTDLLKDSQHDFSQDDIWRRLHPLHSVLRVPADFVGPVQTLHLSFREFLLSDKLQHKPFGVDGPATHRMLVTKCLELLSRPNGLQENLCGLKYPGQLRREVNRTLIDERLTPAFQYACRYWVYHVQQSKISIHDDDEVHVFLQKHFLHWLEALSLIDRIAEVIAYIGILQSLTPVRNL